MTGPEHFAHAQSKLNDAARAAIGSDQERYCLAVAQVHATLALTAATLNPNRLVREESGAWDKAFGAGV